MPCEYCNKMILSNRRYPFPLADGYNKDTVTFVCKHCGQKWWCHDLANKFWAMVDDVLTWANLNSPEPHPIPIFISDDGKMATAKDVYWRDRYIHPENVCAENINRPKLFVQNSKIVVQWLGKFEDVRNIFSLQFYFPVHCNQAFLGYKSAYRFAENYHVAFLGSAKEWAEIFRSELPDWIGKENSVVNLVSGTSMNCKGFGPHQIIFKVANLEDPRIGTIRPESAYHPETVIIENAKYIQNFGSEYSIRAN